MPYREQRPDSGALFLNHRKGDNEKAPDRKGPLNVTCQHCGKSNDLEVAGWIRKSDKGQQYMSLKVSKPFRQEKSDDSIDNW